MWLRGRRRGLGRGGGELRLGRRLLGRGGGELRLGRGGQRGGVWLLRWRCPPIVLLLLLR